MGAHPDLLQPGTWTCALHPGPRDHGKAKPLRGAVHHVLPLGAGGQDVAANRVTICSNGHDAAHAVMWELANGRTPPACAPSELALAHRGVDAWVAAGGVIGQHVPLAFLG